MDDHGNYFPEEHRDEYEANKAVDESLRVWDKMTFLRACDTEIIDLRAYKCKYLSRVLFSFPCKMWPAFKLK